MTQAYRSQLARTSSKARENVTLYRADLRDDIDTLQNRHALQYAEAEIRQVKRQYVHAHCYRSYPPLEL